VASELSSEAPTPQQRAMLIVYADATRAVTPVTVDLMCGEVYGWQQSYLGPVATLVYSATLVQGFNAFLGLRWCMNVPAVTRCGLAAVCLLGYLMACLRSSVDLEASRAASDCGDIQLSVRDGGSGDLPIFALTAVIGWAVTACTSHSGVALFTRFIFSSSRFLSAVMVFQLQRNPAVLTAMLWAFPYDWRTRTGVLLAQDSTLLVGIAWVLGAAYDAWVLVECWTMWVKTVRVTLDKPEMHVLGKVVVAALAIPQAADLTHTFVVAAAYRCLMVPGFTDGFRAVVVFASLLRAVLVLGAALYMAIYVVITPSRCNPGCLMRLQQSCVGYSPWYGQLEHATRSPSPCPRPLRGQEAALQPLVGGSIELQPVGPRDLEADGLQPPCPRDARVSESAGEPGKVLRVAATLGPVELGHMPRGVLVAYPTGQVAAPGLVLGAPGAPPELRLDPGGGCYLTSPAHGMVRVHPGAPVVALSQVFARATAGFQAYWEVLAQQPLPDLQARSLQGINRWLQSSGDLNRWPHQMHSAILEFLLPSPHTGAPTVGQAVAAWQGRSLTRKIARVGLPEVALVVASRGISGTGFRTGVALQWLQDAGHRLKEGWCLVFMWAVVLAAWARTNLVFAGPRPAIAAAFVVVLCWVQIAELGLPIIAARFFRLRERALVVPFYWQLPFCLSDRGSAAAPPLDARGHAVLLPHGAVVSQWLATFRGRARQDCLVVLSDRECDEVVVQGWARAGAEETPVVFILVDRHRVGPPALRTQCCPLSEQVRAGTFVSITAASKDVEDVLWLASFLAAAHRANQGHRFE